MALLGRRSHLPLYWGERSEVLDNDISGHDVQNWLLEYYFTGEEYSLELTRMYGEAMRQRWNVDEVRHGSSPFMILRVLVSLYTREWNEQFHRMARELAEHLIDLRSVNGLTDAMHLGALYKVDRNAMTLYDYYLATGEESARQAILKAIDYQYRFDRIPPPISYQNAAAVLFTIGYRWTHKPGYLRVVNQLVASSLADPTTYAGPHLNMHPTLGMPAALGLLAEVREPPAPFPTLELAGSPETSSILFRKTAAGQPLEMELFVQTKGDGETKAEVAALGTNGPGAKLADIRLAAETMLREPRTRHLRLVVPADTPPGLYSLRIPGAERLVVQETEASQLGLVAPEGFRVRGDGVPYYFQVPQGMDALQLILSRPMEVRRPDGTAAVTAANKNIGELSIPIAGHGGVWSVVAAFPGYVRLLNVPPVVAYGLRQSLPTGAAAPMASRFTPPPAKQTFVAGRSGQALHLAGARRASFARGGKTADGYRHFPGSQGTVEFWFRPSWSTTELPVRDGQFRNLCFLQTGSHAFQYRYGEPASGQELYATVSLSLRGVLGQGADEQPVGFTGRQFFKAGQWYHLATTWQLNQGKRGTKGLFNVFVNGVPIALQGRNSPSLPAPLDGQEPFRLKETDQSIILGPVDGSIEQLRVSDAARYQEAFTPPGRLTVPDRQTRVLFLLDGNCTGSTGAGERVTLEVLPH